MMSNISIAETSLFHVHYCWMGIYCGMGTLGNLVLTMITCNLILPKIWKFIIRSMAHYVKLWFEGCEVQGICIISHKCNVYTHLSWYQVAAFKCSNSCQCIQDHKFMTCKSVLCNELIYYQISILMCWLLVINCTELTGRFSVKIY